MQFITTDNRIAVENFQIGYFYTITFNNHNYIITTCTGKGDNFVTFLCSEPELVFDLTMQTADSIAAIEIYGGGTGTNDYNNLSNKPSINNVLLVGNKTTSDLLINDVPAVTSADDSKILMSSYSGGVGSYSWETYSPISSYTDLTDKPTINSVTLSGNKTSSDLGLQSEIDSENPLLSDNVDDTNQTHKFATAAQLEQIATNTTNISNIQTSLATYHKASGTDIYFSETEPTGNIKDGSYWISTSGVKIYGGNIFAASVEQGSFDVNNGGEITSPNRVRTQFENTSVPTGTYTISADGVDDVVVYAYTNANTSDYSAEDSVVSWQAMPYTFTTTSNLYLRFAFRKSNNANITPSVVSNVSLAKYWY